MPGTPLPAQFSNQRSVGVQKANMDTFLAWLKEMQGGALAVSGAVVSTAYVPAPGGFVQVVGADETDFVSIDSMEAGSNFSTGQTVRLVTAGGGLAITSTGQFGPFQGSISLTPNRPVLLQQGDWIELELGALEPGAWLERARSVAPKIAVAGTAPGGVGVGGFLIPGGSNTTEIDLSETIEDIAVGASGLAMHDTSGPVGLLKSPFLGAGAPVKLSASVSIRDAAEIGPPGGAGSFVSITKNGALDLDTPVQVMEPITPNGGAFAGIASASLEWWTDLAADIGAPQDEFKLVVNCDSPTDVRVRAQMSLEVRV